jgi:hypothetical protein
MKGEIFLAKRAIPIETRTSLDSRDWDVRVKGYVANRMAHRRKCVSIFGSDYATADGVGVCDNVHAEGSSDAHWETRAHLRRGGESTTLECCYGRSYSVRGIDPPGLLARSAASIGDYPG